LTAVCLCYFGVTELCCGDSRFLAAAVDVLEQNVGIEGLFRKCGSVNRLKELKVCIWFVMYLVAPYLIVIGNWAQ